MSSSLRRGELLQEQEERPYQRRQDESYYYNDEDEENERTSASRQHDNNDDDDEQQEIYHYSPPLIEDGADHTTCFNDIEHALLAPLYDEKQTPDGFMPSPMPSQSNLVSSGSNSGQSHKSTPHETILVSEDIRSRSGNNHHMQRDQSQSPRTNKKKTIQRKVITRRIVDGVPQVVSSSVLRNSDQNRKSDASPSPNAFSGRRGRDLVNNDNVELLSTPIMGLHDVKGRNNNNNSSSGSLKTASSTIAKQHQQQASSFSPSKTTSPQKKKIVVVKKKNQQTREDINKTKADAAFKLRQLQEEEESFAPLLRIKPPENKEALSGWIPTKFVLLLVILVLAAVAYSIADLVASSTSFTENASRDKCAQLVPATGVHAVPYRMIVLASVTSVLFPLIVNLIKYRSQNSKQDENESSKKQKEKDLETRLLNQKKQTSKNEKNAKKNAAQNSATKSTTATAQKNKTATTQIVTKVRLVERIRLVPVYGGGDEENDEEIGEEEEAYEEEEEYEEEVKVVQDDDDEMEAEDDAAEAEEEEEEEEADEEENDVDKRSRHSAEVEDDRRSLSNSSLRSAEHDQQDEEETFSLTSERLPFLDSIKRKGYKELGWIFQTYGTVDGRWYLLVLLFAIVNFFYNVAEISSGDERATTFRHSNIWERYQSLYMRWFQSGTVAVLGVFFSQLLTSYICFDIAGTPREIGEDNFLKKKLELLQRQRLEAADQELIMGGANHNNSNNKPSAGSRSSSSSGKKKIHSKSNKSSSNSGSASTNDDDEQDGEEMKTQKKFASSAAQQLRNFSVIDEANQERKEAVKLKDMRSLSRVISNIPLPLATLLVSRSPENSETLTFTHVFLCGILMYPGFITHVVPSIVVFLPMTLLFLVPPVVCYLVATYELRPFAALVEREHGKEALCRRHRASVICMILVTRIVATFVLTALFQTMMCYSSMFFVRGGANYGETIANEVKFRDVDCFLWAINHEKVYQWSIVGLIFS